MKIAYLITGHLRTIDKCSRSFYDNIYKKGSDIYVHTWNTEDAKIKMWHKYKFKGKFDIEKKIKEIYNPKDYMIEKQDLKINKELKKRGINVSNISHYYSYYSLIKCYELLKKSGIEYDLIVKLRPDIFFKKELNLESDNFSIACNLVEWDESINGDWRRMKATDIVYYGKPYHFEKLYNIRDKFYQKIRNNDTYIFQNIFNELFGEVNILEYYYNKHWKIQR
jgi:hypothetical protein